MQILDDVMAALEAGRSPARDLGTKGSSGISDERLSKFCKNVIALEGGRAAAN
jgi:hypothetical protein